MDVPTSTATAPESDWRDWLCHPDLLNAMWPRLVASEVLPSTWLSLLGTCRRTRDITLRQAPKAKLTLRLASTDTTSPSPLLLLQHSGRTKPTTITLLNKLAGEPTVPPTTPPTIPPTTLRTAPPTIPPAALPTIPPTAPPTIPPTVPLNSQQPRPGQASSRSLLSPYEAKLQSHCILSQRALRGCLAITCIELWGVMLDPDLLKAMRSLPSLTRLDLRRIVMSPHSNNFDRAHLPRHIRTLIIGLDADEAWQVALYSHLLNEFLALDTINDLQLKPAKAASLLALHHGSILSAALGTVVRAGRATHSLRKVSAPCVSLDDDLVQLLRQAAPRLQDLEVYTTDLDEWYSDGQLAVRQAVTWVTLRVDLLSIDGCRGLPLGGAAGVIEIHIKRALCAAAASLVEDVVAHLSREAIRRVRLVGAGADGGTFVWDNGQAERLHAAADELRHVVSVLCLSKAPVTRLDLVNLRALHLGDLTVALRPLPALTKLKVQLRTWDPSHRSLLAQLPLHVEHVCLDGEETQSSLEAFRFMLVRACKVRGRQDRPLRVSVVTRPVGGGTATPLGLGSEVWRAVGRCHAQGAVGLVMGEYWE